MNKYFVNIKVDREERPDLDKIYKHHRYFSTKIWRLASTMFLSHENHAPFFGGLTFQILLNTIYQALMICFLKSMNIIK